MYYYLNLRTRNYNIKQIRAIKFILNKLLDEKIYAEMIRMNYNAFFRGNDMFDSPTKVVSKQISPDLIW